MENADKRSEEFVPAGDEIDSDRLACDPEDLIVVDCLCDACAYRTEGNAASCRKYPNGKPENICQEGFFCPRFAVIDLDILMSGG